MGAPVTPSQFCELVPSPVSSICTRVKNSLVLLPQRLCDLVSYMFDSTGAPTTTFIRDMTSGLLPPGVVLGWLSDITPSGWLRCDGSPVSRTGYASLFAIIGTRYGTGDGATTFNLPDFRGRVLVGAGTGAGLTPRALGDTFGEETHQLTEAEMPSHHHDVALDEHDSTSGGDTHLKNRLESGGTIATSSDTGGDVAHQNCQPSGVAYWIIKT